MYLVKLVQLGQLYKINSLSSVWLLQNIIVSQCNADTDKFQLASSNEALAGWLGILNFGRSFNTPFFSQKSSHILAQNGKYDQSCFDSRGKPTCSCLTFRVFHSTGYVPWKYISPGQTISKFKILPNLGLTLSNLFCVKAFSINPIINSKLLSLS